jgi:hypothetical protein
MPAHLEVDAENRLVEPHGGYPAILRIIARIVSYVFHPLFIPVYLCALLVERQPFLYASLNTHEKWMFLLRFSVIYAVFPLISVLLMKALGFIKSIHLRTQRERIIPYVTCMIYYWWMWYVLRNQPEFPRECVVLSLAIFMASVAGLMANIKMKVSMHGLAVGVMSAFVLMMSLSQDEGFGLWITVALLATGAVCSARMIDSDHLSKEVYWGLILGMGSLVLAHFFT